LAVLLRGKLDAKEFVPYIVSQVLGAVAAALTANLVCQQRFSMRPKVRGGPGQSAPPGWRAGPRAFAVVQARAVARASARRRSLVWIL
jgi:glycerol uptake facilitator-like aquaporin